MKNNEIFNFEEYKATIDESISNKTINKFRLREDYFDICRNFWIIDKYIACDGVFEEGMTPNTLTSYSACIKQHYAISIPVQMLDDESIVCFSHKNISKIIPTESGYLKTMTLEQVKNLKLNTNGDTIPTLEETLECIAGKTPIVIEIINDGMVEKFENKIIQLISKYSATHNCHNSVAIMSINPYTLEHFLHNYPYVTRILKSGNFEDKMYGSIKTKKLKKIKLYKNTLADFISYSHDLLPCIAVEKHKPVGIIAHGVTSQNQYIAVAEHCDNIIFKNFKPTI